MNKNKIGNLLAYISSVVSDVNLRKLIKLVYLIDERSVATRGIAVTWLDYYVWEKGPVSPYIYDVKNQGGAFASFISTAINEEGKIIVSPLVSKQDSALLFSTKELLLIDSILNEYGRMSADELTEVTHRVGGLWDKACKLHHLDFSKQQKTNIKLDLCDLVAEDEEKKGIYEDAYEIALI